LSVHTILECFTTVDENYGNLISVLSAQFRVGIDVYLAPVEVGLALEMRESLLYDIAEMTFLA
jgi:hypothetical protein